MINRTAERIASVVLYAAAVAVPLSIVATPAHAETYAPAKTVQIQETVKVKGHKIPGWTKADKKLMAKANKTCDAITDDVTFEGCVVGIFHLSYHGPRVITDQDFTYSDAGTIVLLQANGKVA